MTLWRETKQAFMKRTERCGIWREIRAWKRKRFAYWLRRGYMKADAASAAWDEARMLWPREVRVLGDVPDPDGDWELEKSIDDGEPARVRLVLRSEESQGDGPIKMPEGMRSGVDLVEDILWVYSVLGDGRVSSQECPSRGAWGLLLWAREYQREFFDKLLPKAISAKEQRQEGLGKVKDERARIEKMKELLEGALRWEGEEASSVQSSQG